MPVGLEADIHIATALGELLRKVLVCDAFNEKLVHVNFYYRFILKEKLCILKRLK